MKIKRILFLDLKIGDTFYFKIPHMAVKIIGRVFRRGRIKSKVTYICRRIHNNQLVTVGRTTDNDEYVF